MGEPGRQTLFQCSGCRRQNLGDGGDGVPGHTQAFDHVVSGDVVCDQPEKRGECVGDPAGAGVGELPTAWTWLHKLRRAVVRPGRDKLSGWVEVDETYFGGLEEGKAGRGDVDKALIVIAAEADGKAIGRVRMRVIGDASAGSLLAFVKDCIEPGSTIHTDGWEGYAGLPSNG